MMEVNNIKKCNLALKNHKKIKVKAKWTYLMTNLNPVTRGFKKER